MSVRVFAAFVAAAVSAGPAAVYAQAPSLADVARQEEARRKDVKEPSKVLTNQDLTAVPATTAPPVAETPKGAAADTKEAEKDKAKATDKPAEPVKDQAYWAGRKKELQTALDRDQMFADALQTKINALTRDFVNEADPARRAVYERDRQKSLRELDRLKKAVEDGKKELANLDEEARRAGVPPGWLR